MPLNFVMDEIERVLYYFIPLVFAVLAHEFLCGFKNDRLDGGHRRHVQVGKKAVLFRLRRVFDSVATDHLGDRLGQLRLHEL